MATEGASLLHGGHPIATRIEEKLRSSLKVEHFVSLGLSIIFSLRLQWLMRRRK